MLVGSYRRAVAPRSPSGLRAPGPDGSHRQAWRDLRELEALGHMAKTGAKFVVGLAGKNGLAEVALKD